VDLHRVRFTGADFKFGYSIGDKGTFLKSTDFGLSWNPRSLGLDNNPNLFGLTCPSPDICWMTGEGGSIYKTSDGGNTFTSQNSGTTENLHDIFALDGNHAWAVGSKGVITYTKNGGVDWDLHLNTGLTTGLRRIYFKDVDNGVLLGNHFLGITGDGGETFTNIIDRVIAVLPTPVPGHSDRMRDPMGFSLTSLWGNGNNFVVGKHCYKGFETLDFGKTFDYFKLVQFKPTPTETATPEATPVEQTPQPTSTGVTGGGGGSAGPTPTSTETPNVPVATATSTPTSTPPAGATGCAAVHGLFRGDGGCQVGATEVTQNGNGTLTINPLGTNGAQKFNINGTSASSQSTTLFFFAVSPHECTMSCNPNGALWELHCQRTGNPGISCDEQFS
jgi:photosystem II stability/assembly factor-like uncharacterized protein